MSDRGSALRLGRTQRLVLHLLACQSKSARHLSYDGFGLSESAARSAVMRLADRGLVDAAGWEPGGGGRVYCLTERGARVERGLVDGEGSRDAS